MQTVTLSDITYQLLEREAESRSSTPDQVADQVLREQLTPKHPHIELVQKPSGATAVIKGTRIAVGHIVGYMRMGETPELLVQNILPHLTLAQVHDALSYYYDHQAEVDDEMRQNTEEYGKAYLHERLGEEGYTKVTRKAK